MENINAIFLKNSFASYPSQTGKICTKKYDDIFDKKNNDSSEYLDILYNDKEDFVDDVTNLTDLLKTYLPIKNQNLHFGKFYL